MKNKKISKSLKKYHRKKRGRNDVKKILWVLALVALFGIYAKQSVLSPVEASAPYARNNLMFPESEDKTNLTVKEEIIMYAQMADFKWIDYLLRLTTCENREHIIDLPANAGNYPADSIDRGLFAINSYWHSEVSDECAYNVKCATEWTMWWIESGNQHEWVCNDLVLNNPDRYEYK